MIDEPIFSFLVGDGDQQDYFTIGGYDLDSYATSELNWHSLRDQSRWSVNFDGIKLDDTLIEASSNLGLVDSGASFLMMPRVDFNKFYSELSLTHNCQKYYMNMMIVFCSCSADTIQDFPTLSLVIDGIDYTIPPSTYVSPTTNEPDNISCLLDVSY